jgi:predicted transcriptional regulator
MNMTENELLAELAGELMIDERLPGDVTVIELSKKTGLCKKRCSDILREKIEKGELVRHKVRSESGNAIYAYHKPLK